MEETNMEGMNAYLRFLDEALDILIMDETDDERETIGLALEYNIGQMRGFIEELPEGSHYKPLAEKILKLMEDKDERISFGP